MVIHLGRFTAVGPFDPSFSFACSEPIILFVSAGRPAEGTVCDSHSQLRPLSVTGGLGAPRGSVSPAAVLLLYAKSRSHNLYLTAWARGLASVAVIFGDILLSGVELHLHSKHVSLFERLYVSRVIDLEPWNVFNLL